jgi:2-dehydro-3-deoxyphosphogluconate aldolase / (4S)-4-hydroxy-2-oxoglutarate aldolase
VAHNTVRNEIFERKIIAVVRVDTFNDALFAVDALVEANISIIEITLTTPGAIELIARHADREGLIIGAGSVLDMEGAERAIDAGARFYASPIFDPDICARMRDAGCVTMPGAATPTEMHRAWKAGADLIKIFPMPEEGARFIRAIRGPFPDIRLAPSGGVTPETAPALLRAGAAALNVGTWLTHERDGQVGTVEKIRERAEEIGKWGFAVGG